jgi:putative SOS response-associated peptidase YedK
MPAARLPPAIGAQHNIAPTDSHFIVTTEYERRRAQVARWGLVNHWARDNRQASKCINARAETIGILHKLSRGVPSASLRDASRLIL